ncbi:MAG: YdcF family protein [Faecousia sp.]
MMKKADKGISLRMILLVLAAAAVWLFTAWIFTSNDPVESQSRDEKSIIQDILYAYCREQDLTDERMVNLLKELDHADREQARRWREILDCWQEANNEMQLHDGSLPGGLNNSDKLCLIVLGFQLNPDGSMQEELVGRLETALESAKQYPDSYILCTGGGTASAAPEATEADAMAQWLIGHGIEEARIIVENRSLTTSQNAIFSYQILTRDYPEITETAIISSDYHIPWASILFQTQFILGEHPMNVVSNAAYRTGKEIKANSLLRYQLNGILEIAGLS